MMNESISITRQRAATDMSARMIEKKLLPRAMNGPEN